MAAAPAAAKSRVVFSTVFCSLQQFPLFLLYQPLYVAAVRQEVIQHFEPEADFKSPKPMMKENRRGARRSRRRRRKKEGRRREEPALYTEIDPSSPHTPLLLLPAEAGGRGAGFQMLTHICSRCPG
ncbi:hypothetical protein INR49_008778 [Caranx melampygus]|nr:hypothetical protein INR49_008778 [Caranx melampygus]